MGYFIEGDIKYSKKLLKLDNDLQFLPKRMKTENVETLVPKLYNNKKYLIHKRKSKQALDHGLVLEKVHRVIKFNQEASLKPYIDMNTDLRKNTKKDLEKAFFKLEKPWKFLRKHRDIKLLMTEARKNHLVSCNKFFFRKFVCNINEEYDEYS